jgi:transcriptional adapter 2-alpha
MRKDPTIEKSEKRVLYVTRDEEELCKKLGIQPRQYMLIKETLLRESVRLGIVDREESLRIFKIDRPICEAIFDFMVEQEEIIKRTPDPALTD